MPILEVPSTLRKLTHGAATVHVSGSTVRAAFEIIKAQFPELDKAVFSSGGRLAPFVNVYVDREDIRYAKGLDTPLLESSTISILTAIAGG